MWRSVVDPNTLNLDPYRIRIPYTDPNPHRDSTDFTFFKIYNNSGSGVKLRQIQIQIQIQCIWIHNTGLYDTTLPLRPTQTRRQTGTGNRLALLKQM